MKPFKLHKAFKLSVPKGATTELAGEKVLLFAFNLLP